MGLFNKHNEPGMHGANPAIVGDGTNSSNMGTGTGVTGASSMTEAERAANWESHGMSTGRHGLHNHNNPGVNDVGTGGVGASAVGAGGGHRGTGAETYGNPPMPAGQNYPLGGTGAGAAAATGHGGSGGGGGVKKLEGKIEKGLGTMIGSASLQAKGLAKEREAQAGKLQAAELQSAEGLEGEARMRRERAVGLGADPHHRHLGGVRPAGDNSTVPGEQMINMPGTGTLGGNPIAPGGGQAFSALK